MDKVRFGKTELMVSKVGMGCLPIQRLSIPDAVAVVRGAVDLGINFLDTANGYTDSEEKIGAAIKDIPRENLVIASKSHATDKKTLLEHLDLSLKRLGTDYLDLYQHHAVSTVEKYDAIMAEGGAYEGMLEAVSAGKLRFPGFTSHSVALAKKIMREQNFYSVQLPFNYVDVEAANEAIPLAQELDMGFIAMKPFGGGLLDDANLSMKYLMQFDSIVPDPGVMSMSEMEEIVRIYESGQPLSAAEMAAIEAKRAELGSVWCHRCDYCQPCQQDIKISGVLTIDSLIKRAPYIGVMRIAGANLENARNCIECGDCVQRCPYNLDIPALIKEKLAIWDEYLADNQPQPAS
ncbi:MAG: aldo/keto reductase [Propionibacteriaceae bacterium]|nr:aldo/keto reductase [Propionibacteriaceae bacterium]